MNADIASDNSLSEDAKKKTWFPFLPNFSSSSRKNASVSELMRRMSLTANNRPGETNRDQIATTEYPGRSAEICQEPNVRR
jgi:hypothetical protein